MICSGWAGLKMRRASWTTPIVFPEAVDDDIVTQLCRFDVASGWCLVMVMGFRVIDCRVRGLMAVCVCCVAVVRKVSVLMRSYRFGFGNWCMIWRVLFQVSIVWELDYIVGLLMSMLLTRDCNVLFGIWKGWCVIMDFWYDLTISEDWFLFVSNELFNQLWKW